MQLTEFLQQLWLTANESQMYIALLACNTSPASLVAKKCGVDRSNSYKLLESLIQKGFVSMSLKGWTKYYSALDPQALHYKVQQLQNTFEQLLPQLQELIPVHTQVVETQYYEGIEGFRSMWYTHLSSWRESMKKDDNIRWGYQDHELVTLILPQLEEYWGMKESDEYVKIITNDTSIEKNLNIHNRTVKFLQNHKIFTWNSLRVCGDYSILITQHNGKISMQHSLNPAFASSMKILIQYIRESI